MVMGWLGRKEKTGPGVTRAPGSPGGDAADDVSAKKKIGKYDVVAKIGGGGFGTVYEGFDPLIQRKVAIKTCEVGTPELRARTFQEAQLAGRLQHPNITTVYEFGIEDDVPYIVQEFLTGADLDKVIATGVPLPIGDKLKILLGIALGLDYAHRAGVIHRDIKPSNIRVLEGNAIKIMDFGIAKAQNEASEITKTGMAVGSAGYMSPEQICGDPVDHRADIFSFGALAYELLSGRKAFRSDNLFKLLEAIVKDEPEPLASAAPEVPAALAEIVHRTLHKDPAKRFQNAEELRDALISVHDNFDPMPVRVDAAGTPVPANEAARMAALARFDILDSDPEREFDDLARLASQICGTPYALITLVDRDRQWFKARVGVEARETPRSVSVCAHAILRHDPLVVPDATKDSRFSDNPLVKGGPGFHFYAGAPLVTNDGQAIGTICVLDRVARQLDPDQIESLRALSRQVVSQLELRRRVRAERGRSGEALIRQASGVTRSEPRS